MAQEQTHKYATEIYILRETARQLEKGTIAPSISGQELNKKLRVLFTETIIDQDYRIEIKER